LLRLLRLPFITHLDGAHLPLHHSGLSDSPFFSPAGEGHAFSFYFSQLPWERLEDNSSTKSNGSGRWNLVKFAKKLMIFERKIRIKDQGLRDLQRKIIVQSIVASVIATAVLEAVFLVLPIWK
jgi:hypothetical protein